MRGGGRPTSNTRPVQPPPPKRGHTPSPDAKLPPQPPPMSKWDTITLTRDELEALVQKEVDKALLEYISERRFKSIYGEDYRP
ncbi:hypothetical protein [Phaeovulum veldkampii]|uniref:hypothetical protein n=1 Tax=Phaeovulum veldkampii TaxID=33049 RepID=UPI0010D0EFD1|nr:hypothetical protein [Phaeovulum veldkampii]TDQ56474.1 hypothetical protein EV658_11861 [Phaeovulum veldkampii DSM 11550]